MNRESTVTSRARRSGFARLARHTFAVRFEVERGGPPQIVVDRAHAHRDVDIERLPDGGFVAVDGYLFDDDELADVPRDRPARTIAAGYARHGADVADRLRGAFGFAIWDAARRTLVLGRDPSGLTSFFYAAHGGVFVASPSMDGVLAEPEVPTDYDLVVLAEMLSFSYPDAQREHPPYRHVRRLLPAHVAEVSRAGVRIRRYYRPYTADTPWATPAEVSRFPAVLERAVRRCLRVGADSIALSGGYDSISIALAAARQRGQGPPLLAISLRALHPSCDESATQSAVAQELGMPHILCSLDESLGGKSLAQAAFDAFALNPCPIVSVWDGAYTGLLRLHGRAGRARMLLGTGGDELFNVGVMYGADCMRARDWASLYRFYRAWQRSSPLNAWRVAYGVFWQGALRPTITEELARRFPAAVGLWRTRPHAYIARGNRELRAALVERRLRDVVPERPRDAQAYPLAIAGMLDSAAHVKQLDIAYAWGRAERATLLLPFYDRDVVELALRMHPDDLLRLGRLKSPLRSYVAELAERVPMPPRKVDFSRYSADVLRGEMRATWNDLGGARRLRELGLVDERRLAGALDAFTAGRSDLRHALWVALCTERWLRMRDGLPAT